MTSRRQRSARSTAAPALSETEERFCQEYLVDLCAAAAMRRARPDVTDRSARELGYRAMKRVAVLARIAELQAERAARTAVTADYVIGNLCEVVERCMQRAPVMVRRGREIVQLKDEEERDVWQFDARGAVSSLKLLGMHRGMFTEKVEHSGPAGGPIRVEVVRRIIQATPAPGAE